ncbi:MAG: hypothetical protein HQM03_04025 [Magnetococcales bacterium]|nr:hypothetical protein [Magnetococcales bacterium]
MGILVLILSVLLLPVPLFGGYLTPLPALLALLARGSGLRFALAGMVVNLAHVLLFSDLMRFNAQMGLTHGRFIPVAVYVGLAALHLAIGWRLWHRLPPRPITRKG